MSHQAKRVWKRIVDDLPVDFYKQHELDLLRQYCEVAARAVKASYELDRTGGEVIEQEIPVSSSKSVTKMVKNPWMEVLNKCNIDLCSLATKLRLAKNSKLINQNATKLMSGRTSSPKKDKGLLFGGNEF